MNVDNAFIPVWKQFLLFRKLNDCNDSFELLRLQAVIHVVANHIAPFDLVLFQSFDSELHVFSRNSIGKFFVLCIENLSNDKFFPLRQNGHCLILSYNSRFKLPINEQISNIFKLVYDWKS